MLLSVRDDGKGFNPGEADPGRNGDGAGRRQDLQGFGLFSIRTRLEHWGGKMEVRSRMGSGTEITLIVPVQPAAAAAPAPPAENLGVPALDPGYNPSTTSHGQRYQHADGMRDRTVEPRPRAARTRPKPSKRSKR